MMQQSVASPSASGGLQITRRGVMAGGVMLAARRRARAQTPANPNLSFTDSVGINTHLSSEPYLSKFTQVRTALATLGVKHIRDELRLANDLTRWQTLYDTLGIRSHLLVSPATNTVAEMIDYLRRLGPQRVSAIEGQNEGDSDWFQAQPAAGGDWAAAVIAYQRAVFEALRLHYPAMPVISPTVLDWKPHDMALLKPAAPYCDIVALHPYLQHGEPPETPNDYAALLWYLHAMRDVFKPGAPVMATETGYFTARGGVTEAHAATYLPRLLLNNFAAGIRRTFLYELMDEGTNPANSEDHWGLLRVNGMPKPAFTAVTALMAGLAGTQYVPGVTPLAGGPTRMRSLTFRKADQSTVVAVWNPFPGAVDDAATATIEGRFSKIEAQVLNGSTRVLTGSTVAVYPAVTLLHLTP